MNESVFRVFIFNFIYNQEGRIYDESRKKKFGLSEIHYPDKNIYYLSADSAYLLHKDLFMDFCRKHIQIIGQPPEVFSLYYIYLLRGRRLALQFLTKDYRTTIGLALSYFAEKGDNEMIIKLKALQTYLTGKYEAQKEIHA